MSSNRYNAINSPLQRTETRYYSVVEITNSLERYGSSQLDQDIFGITVIRSTKDQQMLFVRKVILITTGQFLLVSFITFFTARIYPLFQWLRNSTYSWWITSLPVAIVAVIMLWQLKTQHKQLSIASRITMLSLFTVSMAVVASNTISKLIYVEGTLVMMMSISGLCCLLLYTLQKKFPFSGALPFVCSLGAICLSSLWLRWIYEMDPLEIVIPIAVASLVCIYVVVEIYFVMMDLYLEDYILANVYLFVDIAYPIRFIHHFCELTDNTNTFPEILYPGDV